MSSPKTRPPGAGQRAGAMDPLVAVQSLEGVHLSFVSEVVEALHRAKITVDWLGQPTKKDTASQGGRGATGPCCVRRSMLFNRRPRTGVLRPRLSAPCSRSRTTRQGT